MAREYGTSVETSAAPEKVWRIWSDMSTWGEWNPNVETMDWSGGFVSGSGGFYLTLAAHLSAAAKCAVFLPDYRLAPEHRFPAGLEDCIRAYEWMVTNGPSGPAPSRATFIAGDSAGGSLTLATLLALRDRRLPLPVGGIALSPTTDLTLTSESLSDTFGLPLVLSEDEGRFTVRAAISRQ